VERREREESRWKGKEAGGSTSYYHQQCNILSEGKGKGEGKRVFV